MPHNKDILWKGLLEWIFDDLLRFKFQDADRVFNLSEQFVFMDKELATLTPGSEDEMTVRVVDKLVKVQLKSNMPALVHVEIQGATKKEERRLFGARMFQYFNLIFAKHSRPLAAIAIYTGESGHLFPKSYSYSLMNTQIRYQYDTLNIWDYSDGELFDSNNPFAWALVIAEIALLRADDRERRWLDVKLSLLKKLYDKGLFENRKLQAVLVFMEHYLPFKDPEIRSIFRERVDRITGKNNTMDIFEQVTEMAREEGLKEGREKGLKEGLREGEQTAREKIVRQLVNDTAFPDEQIAALVGCSEDQVASIRKQLISK